MTAPPSDGHPHDGGGAERDSVPIVDQSTNIDAVTGGTAHETLTWQGFGDATRALAHQVVDSGWMPDLIVAVARGGLLPAGAMSYAMGIKVIGTMNVEFYTAVDETLPEPRLLPPFLDVSDLSGKRVLVVDDVADSGETLRLVMELLSRQSLPLPDLTANDIDARSATLYVKPHSILRPDYTWRQTDRWINFPWSTLPVITPSAP